MDHPPEKDRDVVIDIDSHFNSGKEVDILGDQDGKVVSFMVCSVPMAVDDLANSEIEGSQLWSTKHVGGVALDSGKNSKRDSRKSISAKKPPKPPRPPRGLSLDAADQKLIKEITELAMIKRARIERMKALKKMKAGKLASTISASSSGSLIALVFTILFCIVIVFQGCHSSGVPIRNNSAIHIHGSSESSGSTYRDNNIVVQHPNLSTSHGPLTSTGSPGVAKLVSGPDIENEGKRSIS